MKHTQLILLAIGVFSACFGYAFQVNGLELIGYEGDSLFLIDPEGKGTTLPMNGLSEAQLQEANSWIENNPERGVIYFSAESNPKPVKTISPKMPTALKRERLKGMVTVKVILDESGDVIFMEVNKSSDNRLNKPTLEALRDWKFKPAQNGGKNIKFCLVVPMKFS